MAEAKAGDDGMVPEKATISIDVRTVFFFCFCLTEFLRANGGLIGKWGANAMLSWFSPA